MKGKVCLIYGSASDTPWVDEVMLRVAESEEVARAWIQVFQQRGYWENLHYEIWEITSYLPD